MIFAQGDVKPIMITWSLSPLKISNLVINVYIISISHDPKFKSKVKRQYSSCHKVRPSKQNSQNIFRHVLMQVLNTSHFLQRFLMELHWLQKSTLRLMILTYSIFPSSKLLKTLQHGGITVLLSFIYSSSPKHN